MRLEIPEGTKAIPERAYFANTEITELVIPSSVQKIGKEAFCTCVNLKTIHFSEGLKWLGIGVFQGCSSLVSVNLPSSLKVVSPESFQDCTALVEVNFPEGLEKIYDYAFADCVSLKHITLPDSFWVFGTYAFEGCASLASVHLPDRLDYIPIGVFKDCKALSEIHLPEKLIAIAHEGFEGCEALTTITLPEGFRNLTFSVFANCRNLREVNFPASLNSVAWDVFWGTPFFEEDYKANLAFFTTFLSHVKGVDQKSELLFRILLAADSIGDDAIGKFVRRYRKNLAPMMLEDRDLRPLFLTSLPLLVDHDNIEDLLRIADDRKLPEAQSALEIHKKNLPALKKKKTNPSHSESAADAEVDRSWVVHRNQTGSLEVIAYIGKEEKAVLPAMYQGKPLKKIGEGFTSGSALELIIPEGYTQLKPFGKCRFTMLTIPGTIKSIPDRAFRNNDDVNIVTLGEGVQSIGQEAFAFCRNLWNIELPQSLLRIKYGAFGACSSMTFVTLPDHLIELGTSAFDSCTKLRYINIPPTITEIPTGAFSHTQLVEIKAHQNITMIGYESFANVDWLESLVLPQATEVLIHKAFMNCPNLRSVELPEGLRSIGYEVFADCASLEEINMPSTVSNIGAGTFRGCVKLFENFEKNLPVFEAWLTKAQYPSVKREVIDTLIPYIPNASPNALTDYIKRNWKTYADQLLSHYSTEDHFVRLMDLFIEKAGSQALIKLAKEKNAALALAKLRAREG